MNEYIQVLGTWNNEFSQFQKHVSNYKFSEFIFKLFNLRKINTNLITCPWNAIDALRLQVAPMTGLRNPHPNTQWPKQWN